MRTRPREEWLTELLAGSVEVAIFGRSRVSRGWALAERVVPEHYLFLLLDGAASFAAAGRRSVLQPGACVWLAPGIAHTLRPLDPQRRIRFYHLRFRLRNHGEELRHTEDLVLLPQGRSLQPQIDALLVEHAARLEHREPRFRALLAALLADLLRLADAGDAPPLTPPQRQRLLALSAERLPRPLHPRELAAAVGLSLDYFTRQFRRTFGMAPRAWLLRERLRAIASILADSDEPLAVLSARYGFASPYLFNRQFRRVMGAAPGAWRRRRRQQAP
jgi:AraC-like DNA-binding protein